MFALSCVLLLVLAASPLAASDSIPNQFKARYVIHIVVDGLAPTKVSSDLQNLPNFKRLREEGATTDNARNEYDSSQTTPNHVSMFTGLSIQQHGYKEDGDNGTRLKQTSIFELVSDAGMKTCLYTSKEKFKLFDRSWPIDEYHFTKDTRALTNSFINQMNGTTPCNYAFVHWKDADTAGHRYKGPNTNNYKNAVRAVDEYLGQVYTMIDSSSRFRGKTAIILTSDHGFGGSNHADKRLRGNYQILFNVWGPGVSKGGDLYKLNPKTRKDPETSCPNNSGTQPIRCHDSGVLAADYLSVQSFSGRFANLDLAVGSDTPSSSPSVSESDTPSAGPSSKPSVSISDTPSGVGIVGKQPSPTPMPLAQVPTSPLPKGVIFKSDFDTRNVFTDLSRVRVPTSFSGATSQYVGKFQVNAAPAMTHATAYMKNEGQNIPAQGGDVLEFKALVHLASSPKGNIVFQIIIRTDNGDTVRGRVMALTEEASKSNMPYNDTVIVTPGASKRINQVRLKIRNLSSNQPTQTGYVSNIQVVKQSEQTYLRK